MEKSPPLAVRSAPDRAPHGDGGEPTLEEPGIGEALDARGNFQERLLDDVVELGVVAEEPVADGRDVARVAAGGLRGRPLPPPREPAPKKPRPLPAPAPLP